MVVESETKRLFKTFKKLVIVSAVIGVSLISGLSYVVCHFVAKNW